jgi:DNA processing protein
VNNETLKNFTVCLSRIKGFGPVTFQSLFSNLGSIETVYDYVLNNKESKITMNKDFAKDDILNILQKRSIKYKCYWELDYPEQLRNIPDAPIVIYYKGEWDSALFEKCISIVGTRKASFYGQQVTKKLTAELVENRFSIVSGMALGIDREAHLETLNRKGKTIAVLGTSVDMPTPASNIDIYKRILDNGGLVISEFTPDVKFVPALFASRNRIIAGLSVGTVIIEAGEKSGALITAELALDYNREVFCVPGNIDNPNAFGSNKLIKESKAKLIQNATDILSELSLPNISEAVDKVQDLNYSEGLIYNDLLFGGKSLEQLLESIVNLTKTEMLATLSLLELKSIIVKNDQGIYSIN